MKLLKKIQKKYVYETIIWTFTLYIDFIEIEIHTFHDTIKRLFIFNYNIIEYFHLHLTGLCYTYIKLIICSFLP